MNDSILEKIRRRFSWNPTAYDMPQTFRQITENGEGTSKTENRKSLEVPTHSKAQPTLRNSIKRWILYKRKSNKDSVPNVSRVAVQNKEISKDEPEMRLADRSSSKASKQPRRSSTPLKKKPAPQPPHLGSGQETGDIKVETGSSRRQEKSRPLKSDSGTQQELRPKTNAEVTGKLPNPVVKNADPPFDESEERTSIQKEAQSNTEKITHLQPQLNIEEKRVKEFFQKESAPELNSHLEPHIEKEENLFQDESIPKLDEHLEPDPKKDEDRSEKVSQDESTSELEHNETEEQRQFFDKALEQIESIKDEVGEIDRMIETFTGTNENHDDFVYMDEVMMHNLIKLDNVDTNNDQELRRKRRDAIQYVQQNIVKLDNKLKSNKEGAKKKVEVETGSAVSAHEENGQKEHAKAAKEEENQQNLNRKNCEDYREDIEPKQESGSQEI